MTTQLEAAEAIVGRFNTEVEVAYSGGLLAGKVVYPNMKNRPPTDGSMWVHFTILDGQSDIAMIGGTPETNLYRTPGVAVASIYDPLENATRRVRLLAEHIRGVFIGKTVDGVRYYVPYLTVLGRTGGFWQVNVTVPYDFDQIG